MIDQEHCVDRPPARDEETVSRVDLAVRGGRPADLAVGAGAMDQAPGAGATERAAGAGAPEQAATPPPEIGGRQGPDPTRYGDWELRGRCIDF